MKKLTIIILFAILSVTAYAQNKLSLGVNGEVAVPMDLFGDAVKTGFGGNVYGSYSITENIDLSLSVGYLTWSIDNAEAEAFDISLPDMSFNAIPVMAGMKYYFIEGSFKPYAALDLGIHFISRDVVASSSNTLTTESIITESNSESKAGWGIGLGFIAALSPTIDLDVAAKLKGNGFEVINGDEDSGNYEKATVMFFGINAGVKIKL